MVKTAGHRVEGEGLILEWGGLVLGSMEEKFRTSFKYALPQLTAEVQICSCSDKIWVSNMWICRCRATFLFYLLADLKLLTAEKVVIADMRICSSATFYLKIAYTQLWSCDCEHKNNMHVLTSDSSWWPPNRFPAPGGPGGGGVHGEPIGSIYLFVQLCLHRVSHNLVSFFVYIMWYILYSIYQFPVNPCIACFASATE